MNRSWRTIPDADRADWISDVGDEGEPPLPGDVVGPPETGEGGPLTVAVGGEPVEVVVGGQRDDIVEHPGRCCPQRLAGGRGRPNHVGCEHQHPSGRMQGFEGSQPTEHVPQSVALLETGSGDGESTGDVTFEVTCG